MRLPRWGYSPKVSTTCENTFVFPHVLLKNFHHFSSSQSQPPREPPPNNTHTHTHPSTTPTLPTGAACVLCLGSLCSCSWCWTEDDTMGWSSWEAKTRWWKTPRKHTPWIHCQLYIPWKSTTIKKMVVPFG